MDERHNEIRSGIVSVIMGIYNCGSTLDEALDSIVKQTYTHWELIMCDDGSQDDTYQVAVRYQRRFPEKIKLLKHDKNQGLNMTLNDCLAEASGEFIARMDGDDISLPERFMEQVSFLNQHPEFSIVSSPMVYFDESGDWGWGKAIEKPEKSDFARNCPFCHAPAMVRVEAYRQCGGYSLDRWTLRCEDLDLWARMYAMGVRGYNIQKPLYKMRDGRDAFSRRKFSASVNDFVTRVRVAHLLHLPWWTYVRAIRPMLVALLPWHVYRFLHFKMKRRNMA